MATLIGKENNVLKLLDNLVELDYDAIAAYSAAIERVSDPEYKRKLSEFKSDHQRHVTDLSRVITSLGGTAPTSGDLKAVLTVGKVKMGNIAGDKGILMAMKTNEDDTNTAYERATSRDDLSSDVRDVLERNLADERRHRAWIEAQLGASKASHRPRAHL